VGVEFVAVDNPHGRQADRPHPGGRCRTRAQAISEGTKAALAAAKARKAARCAPQERMRVARKAQAAQFAANVLPIIRDIQAAGHTRFNAIAGQLNARKVAPLTVGNGDMCRCGRISGGSDAGWDFWAQISPAPKWDKCATESASAKLIA
jgi:hypothetical protein